MPKADDGSWKVLEGLDRPAPQLVYHGKRKPHCSTLQSLEQTVSSKAC